MVIINIYAECKIFARMSPEDKKVCVQMHMKTQITAMCGDGIF